MTSRTGTGACSLLLLLLCFPALASAYQGSELPARWLVRADGWSGTLVLNIESSGRISGTLQDRAVTGFLAGRRIVLRRTVGDRTEVWDGWLPEDSSSAELFVAGSMTVGDRYGGRVRPWYAVPESGSRAAYSPAFSRAGGTGSEPASPEPGRAAEPASPAFRQSASDWKGWALLTGVWVSTEGRIEISQKGRSISVFLPDGSEHAGRFTATDTLVVGLRKGCCKGVLQGPDIIRWSDGAVWRRD